MPRILYALLAVLASAPLAAQTPAGIDSVYAAFSRAYQTTDLGLLRSLYTDDCLYLPAAQPGVQTCEEAMSGFAAMFENADASGRRLDIAFTFVDRSVSGDLAHDVGYYDVISAPQGGEPGHSYGKFVTVLKRGEDGRWRIHVDGYSPAAPERVEAARTGDD